VNEKYGTDVETFTEAFAVCARSYSRRGHRRWGDFDLESLRECIGLDGLRLPGWLYEQGADDAYAAHIARWENDVTPTDEELEEYYRSLEEGDADKTVAEATREAVADMIAGESPKPNFDAWKAKRDAARASNLESTRDKAAKAGAPAGAIRHIESKIREARTESAPPARNRAKDDAAARAMERLRNEGDVRVEVAPDKALVKAAPRALDGAQGGAVQLNEAAIGTIVGAVVDRLIASAYSAPERRRAEWVSWMSKARLWHCPACDVDSHKVVCSRCGDIDGLEGHYRGTEGWKEIARRKAEDLLSSPEETKKAAAPLKALPAARPRHLSIVRS